MDEYKRDFKGIWIPKEVWFDKRLGALDKIILVEIDSLDVDEDGCYASNQYLADFCQCTETKISMSVKKLIELHYLEAIKFDGRKRFLKSSLKKIYRQPLKNLKADFKKFKDNNIYNNIDNNIKKINKKKFKEPTLEEIENYINEKNMNVDAKIFYDYFTESNWVDSKGNKVKSWKQKLITWNSYNKNEVKNEPVWFNQNLDEGSFFTNEQRKRIKSNR